MKPADALVAAANVGGGDTNNDILSIRIYNVNIPVLLKYIVGWIARSLACHHTCGGFMFYTLFRVFRVVSCERRVNCCELFNHALPRVCTE